MPHIADPIVFLHEKSTVSCTVGERLLAKQALGIRFCVVLSPTTALDYTCPITAIKPASMRVIRASGLRLDLFLRRAEPSETCEQAAMLNFCCQL